MKWTPEPVGGPEALTLAVVTGDRDAFIPIARYYAHGEPTIYTIGFVVEPTRIVIGTPGCYRPFVGRVPAREWHTVAKAAVAVAWYLENNTWDHVSRGASVMYRLARGLDI